MLAKTHDFCADEKPKLTVVMAHGIAADSRDYAGALDYLENIETLRCVRFVTFDLLGAGKSLNDDSLNYDCAEQLEALNNSIKELNVETPLVMAGHSMGALIAVRYASICERMDSLILLSPPIYKRENLSDPTMQAAMADFKQKLAKENPAMGKSKAFNNEVDLIVLNPDNYEFFVKTKVPTTIIYGKYDKVMGAFNLPELLTRNGNICAIKVESGHHITQDKYVEVGRILEKILHA